MRYEKLFEYVGIRIRSTGIGFIGHEAKSIVCCHRSWSMVGPGWGIVDDSKQLAYLVL